MNGLLKRGFDFIISLVGFLILVPIFLVIAILLKFTGEGEVFYFQKRMGYKNDVFDIIKFATMLKNSMNMGNKTVTLRNDPRVTSVGRYLRKTKINELPQIINVIIGDMSLIGPRPLPVNSYKKYHPEVQAIIYQNRPGVTGIGSIVFRDEEKLVTEVKKFGKEPLDYYKEHIYPYKGALESWYYYNVSFITDIKILFLTFWYVFNSKSELMFKIFKSVPPRPEALTIEGIRKIYKTEVV
ncbi:MAG: sugar transferase [Bacteroidetes bacterium]|jgi:lipopolysaccharide/colanic/teichoic acid biosynthesis glycosyltransferase|nr:sugar transferase [Bacteroidota bacterium]